MHPNIVKIYKQRLDKFSKSEILNIYPQAIPLTATFARSAQPVPFKQRLTLTYEKAQEGMVWGHEWDSAWFHVTATVPPEFDGKSLCLRIHLGGEACVFDQQGTPIYGLTGFSVFDENFYKDRFVLGKLKSGSKVDFWIEAAANALFGVTQPKAEDKHPAKPQGQYTATIRHLQLCVFDEDLAGLLLDFRVLNELLEVFGYDDYRGKQLLHVLNQAVDAYAYDPQNAPQARHILRQYYNTHRAYESAPTVSTIGHAHIDVGWLWPVRESIRKAARTFSSQLALMDTYPDYIFGASQPELYSMVKEHYPELFRKIKEKVAEGRWEVQGGMWVEADSNIISGESMVRQFLHGKNFFMDNFGVEVKNLWLPDVFGYSAALPQIMRKAGCDFFLTQKLSWSQINTFPHHTFKWIGVDGSQVITHFLPEDTYNATATPKQRCKGQNAFKEAGYLDEYVSLMGIGDGGGGPSERYLENFNRTRNLEGCPKAVFQKASDFFQKLQDRQDLLPSWQGELYLELHRGTLTTQANTKRNNRKCEQALTQLEFIASCLPPQQYPAQFLDQAWKTVLVNQFHDIIPGSSIGLVYQTTEKQHAEILQQCKQEMNAAAANLFTPTEHTAVIVNTLPTNWQGCITLPDSWKGKAVVDQDGIRYDSQWEDGKVICFIDVPASSFTEIHQEEGATAIVETAQDMTLQNDVIAYTFNSQGQLVSARDVEQDREILAGPANVLTLYNDRPLNYEAWDIDLFYPRDATTHPECFRIDPKVSGPARSYITFHFKTERSTIIQTAVLYPNSTRLDFVTHVEWHEKRTMLRTAFPVRITSEQATYDIQYAYVTRPTHENTSWDQAKFECVGQRYADLSQDDYGVAILNDCKYGYKIKGNTLDLNLFRSPKHPDFNADQGPHDVTYSFYPHPGNHIQASVPEQSAMLNREVFVADGYAIGKALVPCRVLSDSVNLEVIKKAEKDDSHIIRLVETAGKHAHAVLQLADSNLAVSETNLMEWTHGNQLPVTGQQLKLSFTPFEIKTLRLTKKL